jgi:hypothetical protein
VYGSTSVHPVQDRPEPRPLPARQEIHVHHHWHGVTAEDVAVVLHQFPVSERDPAAWFLAQRGAQVH